MIVWLHEWQRKRALARAQAQLEALQQGALSASDYMFRDHHIFSANALLAELEALGFVSAGERREIAGEWVNNYIRASLPAFFREKNADAIERLGRLMQGGSLDREESAGRSDFFAGAS
jgi:hypothetical protein